MATQIDIPHDRRITIAAACQILGTSYNVVHRLGLTGELQMLREHGRWFVDRREVETRARQASDDD